MAKTIPMVLKHDAKIASSFFVYDEIVNKRLMGKTKTTKHSTITSFSPDHHTMDI